MSGNWFDDHSLLSSYRTRHGVSGPTRNQVGGTSTTFTLTSTKVKNETSLKFYFYIFGEKKTNPFQKMETENKITFELLFAIT